VGHPRDELAFRHLRVETALARHDEIGGEGAIVEAEQVEAGLGAGEQASAVCPLRSDQAPLTTTFALAAR
jgi:hypothetical protein